MRRLTLGLILCLLPISLPGCEDPEALVTGAPSKIARPAATATTDPTGSTDDLAENEPGQPNDAWSAGGGGTPPPPDLTFTETPQHTTGGTTGGSGSSGDPSDTGSLLEDPDDTSGDGSGDSTVDPADPGANDNQPGDVTEPGEPGTPGDTGSDPGSGGGDLPALTDP